jgi:tripartite-type tricarboxylate transporter receptor subunit TctC
VSPALSRSLPYDVERDFAFVTMVGTSPSLVAVHPSLGAATLAEVVAKAKARPGELNYASVGKGSVSQLSMAQLSAETGIETVHVPYSGGVQAVAALLAGDVQLLSLVPTALIPHVAAGRLRIVAQTGARRSPLVPDVPTVAESGFPGFEAPVWMALVVPARTPPEAVKRLHAELARIIRAPEMKERLWDRQWIDPIGSTPEEAARVVREETAKWARIGRALGIALE